MDLSQLDEGVEATVVALSSPEQELRLRELGLRPGARVRVTLHAAFGGRVVAVGADRFALDRSMCRGVRIEAAA